MMHYVCEVAFYSVVTALIVFLYVLVTDRNYD